eukprot:TRINITY_DN126_c0_g1_i2.p1 TRINITY_DN126_c0_g1~~TRINITY_DN126_c0_g1_i2.p1  ORF type:complete len:3378 (+),score=908.37 TRINITY_DN126_c0_g1_i2:86-10135(+)
MQHRVVTWLSLATLLSNVDAVNLRSTIRLTGRHAVSSSDALSFESVEKQNQTRALLQQQAEPENFPQPYTIDPKRSPTGRLHVGCVYDTQTEQQRWYDDHVAKEDRVPMTVDLCYSFCQNVTGVQYFGLKRGTKCYCTPFFHNTDKGGHGECDQPCEGDESEFCGGVEMVDVYEMHDCNNLPAQPCRKLPQVTNAKLIKSNYYRKTLVPCQNTGNKPLTTADALCHIECEQGYLLKGNTLKCTEKGDRLTYSWAQMEGSASCEPISCGPPPDTAHTRHTNQAIVFPNPATYTCQLGYEVKGAPDTTQAAVQCTFTGEFSGAPECVPVPCGECPQSDKYANAVPRQPGIRTYGMQCTYDCNEGYTLDRQASGATIFDIRCMATKEFSEPQQCKPVLCGPALDHISAKIESPDPETPIVFPEIAKYACKEGFSLTGRYGDDTKYEVTCKSDGLFSKAPDCYPVSCGAPLQVAHATYPKAVLTYSKSVTYLCNPGYTLTGLAGTLNSKTLTCGPEGKYLEEKPECKPVECGAPPQLKHAGLLTEGISMFVFDLPAIEYQCNPGYSLKWDDDPFAPVMTSFAITCKEDGSLTKIPACVNINDCLVRDCGPHGVCMDVAEPTGNPLDDFYCKCSAGFETSLVDSTVQEGAQAKLCTNIDDCPDANDKKEKKAAAASSSLLEEHGAHGDPLKECCGGYTDEGMRRGKCIDGLMGYTCLCTGGYKVTEVPGLPKNQTCVPVVCGPPPVVKNGKPSSESELNYDSDAVAYKCESGYTLDGTAGGKTDFKATCSYDTSFLGVEACNPVTCGKPVQVPYSDRNPKQPEVFFPDVVTYTCDEGYSLDGEASGEISFDVNCDTDGKQKGIKKCLPVRCGKVPEDKHAKYSAKEFYFPESTEVSCVEGYSTDATTAVEASSYTVDCESDGTFGGVRQCEPINCGKPPHVVHTRRCDDKSDSAKFGTASFEGLDTGSGYKYLDSVGDWTKNGNTVAIKSLNGPWGGTAAGEGSIYLGLQNVNAYIEQTVSTIAESEYLVTYMVAKRGNYGNQDDSTIKITVDGSTIAAFSPAGSSFQTMTFTFKASGASAVIRFENASPPGDKTVFVDGFSIVREPCGDIVYGETVKYTCDPGYTLTGEVGGVSTFTIEAQADGTFSDTKMAFPVKCGVPPEKANTDHALSIERVYTEQALYTCLMGFSVDGIFGSATTFSVDCQTDGTYAAHDGCKPVECGPVVVPEHSAQSAGKAELVFEDVADFKCLAGYSLDAKMNGPLDLKTRCQADGKLTVHAGCLNMDDCDGNKCGAHGTCVDNPDPTGKHIDDYHCQCDSGFKEEIKGDYRICGNIPDCPVGACEPGSCQDLVNDYKCHCPEGYHEDANAAAGLKHDCMPNVCGAPPHLEHASTPSAEPVDFAMKPIEYTCDEGYTLDASPDGDKTFTIGCLADKSFEQQTRFCLPVACGQSPAVEEATYDVEAKWVFPQKVPYTCNEGYTLDGKAQGTKAFSMECSAKGAFEKVQKCVPVECGLVPHQKYGKFEEGATLVYPNKIEVKCNEGYTAGDPLAERVPTYNVACLPDGDFDMPVNCQPLNCGKAPEVTNAESVKGSTEFGGKLDVVAEAGYSSDGTTGGAKAFEIKCKKDGKFGKIKDFQPIACGVPPELEHSASFVIKPMPKFIWERMQHSREDELKGRASTSTHFPDLQTWGVPQLEEAKVKCAGKEECKAFCWNPDDWSWFYPRADQGFQHIGKYGRGWECYKRVEVTSLIQRKNVTAFHTEHSTKAHRRNVKAREGEALFGDTVTYTCKDGYFADSNADGIATIDDEATEIAFSCEELGDLKASGPSACLPVTCPAYNAANSAPILPQQPVKKPAPKYDYFWMGNDKQKELKGRNNGNRVFKNLQRWGIPSQAAAQGLCSNEENCKGFCWNPDDWTFYYKMTDQGFRHTGNYGRGWKCFYRVNRDPEIPGWEYMSNNPLDELVGRDDSNYMISKEWSPKTKLSKDAALSKCDGDDECQSVCWNPDDITFTYKKSDQGFRRTGKYGAGWKCYKKVPLGSTVFGVPMRYACKEGFSLDGTPSGKAAYEKACNTDGTLSSDSSCSKIDYCLISECGANGECVNGGLGYTCNCEAGFKATLSQNGVETCEQIDECLTMGGTEACTTNGKCIDELLGYKCECDSGYEVTTGETGEQDANAGEACTPVVCGQPPAVTNGITPKASVKLFYTDDAEFTCAVGYTTNGKADGNDNFMVRCEADEKFSGVEECKPVECGDTLTIEKSKKDKESLVFPEIAKYTCEKGYETYDGHKKFEVACSELGSLSEPEKCTAVSCGRPDTKPFTSFNNKELYFEDTVTYTCNEGYTTTGKADGGKTLEYECAANKQIASKGTGPKECDCFGCGTSTSSDAYESCHPAQDTCSASANEVSYGCYTDAPETCDCNTKTYTEASAKDGVCMPVTCGVPENVEHAEMTFLEMFYGQQSQIFCDSGYTVDGTAKGEASFTIKCASTGQFEGYMTCKPVSCGKPGEKALGGASSEDGEKFFRETATWNCKEGYSVDGKKNGGTSFEKMCTANGAYGDSSPSDCIDIDYCYGNPCTVNGMCTDSGPGAVGPGYSCECADGFELTTRSDGTPTCKADDCAGDPCGEGGACTDLSKADPPGPAGEYSCECEEGYDLIKPEPKKYTCKRKECGVLPAITNSDSISVKTASGKEPVTDAFTDRYRMFSFDVVSVTCSNGYSTDGGTGPESKSFSVECEGTGSYSRAINGATECQPVRCDNMMLPTVSNTFLVNELENFFEYGDSAKFQCNEGYTTSGRVGGATTFEVPCQANGRFPHSHPQCSPVLCGRPLRLGHASASTGNRLSFPDSFTYMCATGYKAGGQASFTGSCTAGGAFVYGRSKASEPPTCERISCGAVPAFPDAVAIAQPEKLLYGDTMRFNCKSGYKIGGNPRGRADFTVMCRADGTYTNPPGTCSEPGASVTGEVTDAQSASVKIAGATVVFKRNGANVKTLKADSSGRFTAFLPIADLTITVTQGGYITGSKKVKVAGRISRGQGADMALSKVLPPGAWRTTVSWDREPRDVDSHAFFGLNQRMHVAYWGMHKTASAPGTGGIKVDLDRDDTNGFGPETLTFANLGKCSGTNRCLIKFKIKKYSGQGSLRDGHPIVKVYRGDKVEAEYKLQPPANLGRSLYPVFTLDAQTQTLYPGEVNYGPYFDSTIHRQNWWGSFDSQRWSKVPHGAVSTGFFRNGGRYMCHLEESKYVRIKNTAATDCYKANWWGSFDRKGWSTCKPGYFVSGFYRTGRCGGGVGAHQLEEAWCCAARERKTQWGTCTTKNIFGGRGYSNCPANTAVVGLWRSNDNSLNGIDKMKCCEMKGGLNTR